MQETLNYLKNSDLLEKIVVYGRMIKFSHTLFALPFALSAVILASRTHPLTWGAFFWILVALTGARSAAMGFNRIADAAIDKKNPRTAMREIPSGKLSMPSAILFVTGSSAAFILSAAMLGSLCLKLSVPVLGALFLYSYTKRFTWLCHIYLGFAISLAPAGAWIAITNTISLPVILLCLALLTYIGGFDILYACQDAEFDTDEGLHSMPSALGIEKAMKISSALHGASFLFFVLLFFAFDLGPAYLVATAIIGVLLVIEHKLVKPDDLSQIHIAFFHINSVISVVLLAGIFISELL